MDKVVVVIKDKDDVALERFIFAITNMIAVEAFNKDSSVTDAMTPAVLGYYFRSFLIKLSMVESQLGQHDLGEDISFAVVIELKDDMAPTASQGQNPPPWVPASSQQTTAGASDKAELHYLRAVETGIFDLSFAVQESQQKLEMGQVDVKRKQKAV